MGLESSHGLSTGSYSLGWVAGPSWDLVSGDQALFSSSRLWHSRTWVVEKAKGPAGADGGILLVGCVSLSSLGLGSGNPRLFCPKCPKGYESFSLDLCRAQGR